MKKLSLLLLIVSVLWSCKGNRNKNIDKNFVAHPKTLKELFSGFSNNELTPDVYHFNKDSVVIVATGHLYPMLFHPDVYKIFIDSIKAQKPDLFFALGDLVFNNSEQEWDTVLANFAKLKVPVYFGPGNHDLNYHYERYNGSHAHQVEAEMRYMRKAKCRYKVVKDDFANYVFINANDSAKRILSYINMMRPKLDTTKQMIILSSQSLWFNKQQDPKNPQTWPNRPFKREKLLPYITDFKHLIHGDWGGKFFRYRYHKDYGTFDAMGVGNRRESEPLYITRLIVYKDTIIARPVNVKLPENTTWYEKRKSEFNKNHPK